MVFVDYPGHFIAVVLLAIFAGLVLLVFHCRQLHKSRYRIYRPIFMLLRYASIVILLLILWNPSRSLQVDTTARNSVLTLFDTSRSMSVPEDANTTRLEKALNIFNRTFSPSSAKGPEFKIFGFDNQVYHSGSTRLLRRWGSKTDFKNVVVTLSKYDIVQTENQTSEKLAQDGITPTNENENIQSQEQNIKGAVIFTDGQADDLSISGYLPLEREDFPVLIVGIGSRKKNPDVEIKSIDAPAMVALDSVYNVEVVVKAVNLNSRPATIELLKDGRLIDSNQLESELFVSDNLSGYNDVTVKFSVAANNPGERSFTVRAKQLENEINTANNIRGTVVEVVEAEQLNVLYYSQAATFNFGKIRQVLARDKRIRLNLGMDAIINVGLLFEASEYCGYVMLPNTSREFNKYDIIILEQCQLDSFTGEQIDGLYNFVTQRGGGLILLPGRGDYGPGGWQNNKVKSLFPVIFTEGDNKLWPPNPGSIELTAEAVNYDIFDSEYLEENDIEASAFYQVAKIKPAADTLATSGAVPLVCLHRIGRGKVCLLNISQLFLLYREDNQGGLLYKLVSGLISHMGVKPAASAGVELFAERSNTSDDVIRYSAFVCNSSFNPVENANVLLEVDRDILTMNPTGQGYYVVESDNHGSDTVVATAQAEFAGVFLGEKKIAIHLTSVKNEMDDTQLNEEFMQALAARLKGTYVHEDDIEKDIAKMFDSQTRSGSTMRLTSVWPKWSLFFVICALLTIEWFLRRTKGLV
ncbi:hypothetical protein ACFLZ8_03610 [Planctomycetota bacterium]